MLRSAGPVVTSVILPAFLLAGRVAEHLCAPSMWQRSSVREGAGEEGAGEGLGRGWVLPRWLCLAPGL